MFLKRRNRLHAQVEFLDVSLRKSICRNLCVNRLSQNIPSNPITLQIRAVTFSWLAESMVFMASNEWFCPGKLVRPCYQSDHQEYQKTLDQAFSNFSPFEYYKLNSYCSSYWADLLSLKKPIVIYYMRSLYTTSTKEYEDMSTNSKEIGYS